MSRKDIEFGRRTVLRTTAATFGGLVLAGEVVAGSTLNVITWGGDPWDTGATLTGELDDLGGADSADVFFEWRKVGASSWNATSRLTLTSTQFYDQDVTGLESETDYEFRAVAEASDGDAATGDTMSFTTTGDPVVNTERVDNLTDTSATLVGSADTTGGADELEVYFEWGPEGTLSNTTGTQTITPEDFLEPSGGFFTWDISGLESGTTYSFRAVGDASDGDSDTGDVMTFTTKQEPTIDQFTITDNSNRRWARFTVDWAVSDDALDSVTSELLDSGTVVASETTDVSGTSASGTHELKHKGAATDIRLSVTDADGNVTSETKSV